MQINGNKKLKRFLLGFFIILAALILLITIVASPLVTRHIEKHDLKYTGREITIGRTLLNPLAGSVSLKNFTLFEKESDSIFVFIKKLSANISLLKLLSGTYELSSITVDKPEIRIIHNDSIFNFTDLIERFAVVNDTLEDALHLNIKNIKINQGIVRYAEPGIPVYYSLKDLNFSSPGVFWDIDTMNGKFYLIPGTGRLSGDFTLNKETLDYRLYFNLAGFDLGMFEQYVSGMSLGKGNLTASMSIEAEAGGNFNEPLNGKAMGRVEVNDFHFGINPETDYFSFNRFLVSFREIDLKNNRFYFDSILIDKPFLLYQKFDTLDNYRRMFRSQLFEEVEEVADTADKLVDLINSDYYVNSFALTDGSVEFNDYSLAEKFSWIINPFNIKADSIDKANKRVKVLFSGKFQPSGDFNARLSMDPKNEKYFDLNYEFRNIPAPIFNPYILSFTSHQLDRGTIEMRGDWSVRDNNLRSLNHFLVVDPRNTKKRVRGKDTKWVPLPLIMSFVREPGSVIDYEIPIKGDLKDPKFKIRDVLTDLLKNILVKPPTTSYRLHVRNLEKEIEKTLSVRWKMRQTRIEDNQDKFLKDIADFLKDNPEAYLVVRPVYHVEKEKENILMFKAKKKYFFESQKKKVTALSEDDSMKVEKIISKDSSFIKFMNNSIRDPGLLTMQEKCYIYVGKDVVENQFKALVEGRKKAFMQFFVDNNTSKRVEILDLKNQIPNTWFSYFDINYKGDVPKKLSEAFNKLYEIDTDPPRREYFDLRKK